MATNKLPALSRLARGIAGFTKSAVNAIAFPAGFTLGQPWWGASRDTPMGSWQAAVKTDPIEGLLSFSPVYACASLIAKDIAKLRPRLMAPGAGGVWLETTNPAYTPVLRKPNSYQTRIQFLMAWVISKMIWGNTYVLKIRDFRGVVVEMHVLNPAITKPLVTQDGDVYYQCGTEWLAGTLANVVPASEIIHDRCVCLFHPLVGVPPLYAGALSATQGKKIQASSASFFGNASMPSGMISAAGILSDEDAARIKQRFQDSNSGANAGKLLVMDNGLTYTAMAVPAQQSQLIEQLGWTVADVARCFLVPLHKITSDVAVKFSNMAVMNQDYFNQCLQELIEAIELLLDEGLGLTGGTQQYGVEFDLDGLLRMDLLTQAQIAEIYAKSGTLSPNENRAKIGQPPVDGGEQPYMQQQNFQLSALAKQPPPGATPPAPPPAAEPPATPPAADGDTPAKQLGEMTGEVRKFAEALQQMQAKQVDIDALKDQVARDREAERLAQERVAAENKEAEAERLRAAEDLRVAAEARAAEAAEETRLAKEAADAARVESRVAIAAASESARAEIETLRAELDIERQRRADELEQEADVEEFADALIAKFLGGSDVRA